MLRWHIYLQAGKPVDMGILDSNLEKVLEYEYFQIYKKTYPEADYESIWKAYDAVMELWSKVGHVVAERCRYHYPDETERNMLEFIIGGGLRVKSQIVNKEIQKKLSDFINADSIMATSSCYLFG